MTVELRLSGPEDKQARVLAAIAEAVTVTAVRGPYRNRREAGVRVYADITGIRFDPD